MKLYDRAIEGFVRSAPGRWLFANVLHRVDGALMKVSMGRVSTGIGTRFQRSACLLTTTGRRSGRRREVPLLTMRDGGDYVLIASSFGRERNPAWYHNLTAEPRCSLVVDGRRLECTAREAQGDERERLFQKAIELYEGYAEYRERAPRTIPVMVLTPNG